MPPLCEDAWRLWAKLGWQLPFLRWRRRVSSSSDKQLQPAHWTSHSQHEQHVTTNTRLPRFSPCPNGLSSSWQWWVLHAVTADVYGPLQYRPLTIYSRPAQLNVLCVYCHINNGGRRGEGRTRQDRNKHAFEICRKTISHCIRSLLFVL